MNCNWGFNTSRPLVMHVDLNSCFATVEQQARPMLRGRPVAIVNRRAEHATIVTASYEARSKRCIAWHESFTGEATLS